ncbi:MAG TPA: hypothetical protein PLQ97_14930 [Myxococcota bacterium]|nr:hypothetical protein [Myxococcota bacterium]HQK52375.1 hypothetical protein [Myxococcota bacterium]
MDRRKAMRIADGEAPEQDLDPRLRAEVEAFRALSDEVREAATPRRAPPDFEAFFRGVEARYEAAREARSDRGLARWWKGIRERPLWWMAPVGAALAAAALLALTVPGERAPNNACFVDSYDLDRGSVVIDQDPDDPSRATVIWFLEEG